MSVVIASLKTVYYKCNCNLTAYFKLVLLAILHISRVHTCFIHLSVYKIRVVLKLRRSEYGAGSDNQQGCCDDEG